MSNPNINFLNSNLLRQPLEDEITKFLKITPKVFYTSYEIADAISTKGAYKELVVAISSYTEPAFKEPATHIGALCSELNLNGVLKRTQKRCPKLKVLKPAFAI